MAEKRSSSKRRQQARLNHYETWKYIGLHGKDEQAETQLNEPPNILPRIAKKNNEGEEDAPKATKKANLRASTNMANGNMETYWTARA